MTRNIILSYIDGFVLSSFFSWVFIWPWTRKTFEENDVRILVWSVFVISIALAVIVGEMIALA